MVVTPPTATPRSPPFHSKENTPILIHLSPSFFLSLSLFLSNLQQALSPAPAYANRTVDRSRAAEAELEAILKARGGMPSVKVESTVSFFNYKRKKKKDTRDRGRRRRK